MYYSVVVYNTSVIIIIIFAGLERIAEELMGRRKWKLYQECMSRTQQQQQLPINNNVLDSNKAVKQEPETDEQERLKDWSPQSKCYFCVDGKLDSDHTTHAALVNYYIYHLVSLNNTIHAWQTKASDFQYVYKPCLID